jgi:tRNA-2-methylthio-N6-dimethylallyladenosine synthase
LSEARCLADAGVNEITLLGQSISAWRGPGGESIADLLDSVCRVDGLGRVRFLTSHPSDFEPRLIEVFQEHTNLCRHLAMPAQSGSDSVLKRMNRPYTSQDYRNIVQTAREAIPDLEISSDFIVGFPGESEEDFEATLELIEWARFRTVFAFKYVSRPGTAAARLKDEVKPGEKQERLERVHSIQRRIGESKNREMNGRSVDVMVDGPDGRSPQSVKGRTPGNHVVSFEGKYEPGSIVTVRIVHAGGKTLIGEPI